MSDYTGYAYNTYYPEATTYAPGNYSSYMRYDDMTGVYYPSY